MAAGCINDDVLLAMVGIKDAGAVDVAAVVAGWCEAIVGDHIHKILMVMIADGADCASNGTVCKMFAGGIFVPNEPALWIVAPFRRRLLAGYSCPMSLTVASGAVSSSTSSASSCASTTLRERRATLNWILQQILFVASRPHELPFQLESSPWRPWTSFRRS